LQVPGSSVAVEAYQEKVMENLMYYSVRRNRTDILLSFPTLLRARSSGQRTALSVPEDAHFIATLCVLGLTDEVYLDNLKAKCPACLVLQNEE
ncbi:mCG144929, partial [Mus musculus]